ncbi:hypothetical protein, partial [Shewanella sp.]|uniref:hypothetical protein n=1 Tax=Shewanella sp. TaxID=50422 RepID=UPI000E7D2C5A
QENVEKSINMALITRTVENADGTQQIAIFDTTQKTIGEELGLYIDELRMENIVPASMHYAGKSIGKLIFIGKIVL